ncbi:MAG TPA: FMN-binding negative transcriptional regulator [Candidatus Tectomicrobia bacterium]|jgi:transcriptional regulator|nr:FMN-binding negative transcriptional regulator [Candidatus Tectomicrobia bacterium]
MYMPEWFREDDLPTLHALMRDHSFATLVTQHEGVPFASHLPLILAADEGPYGTLFGHMARANTQWRDFDASQEMLVVFQGPHTYVSPSWYGEDPANVPTWNYAAVHAYGSPRLITDDDACRALLDTLVWAHEAPFASPWRFQMPEAELRKKMRGIVTFAVRITRLEGKLKLSQNRPLADQQHVAETLQRSADAVSRDVGTLMQQRQAMRRT